jgi:hypothetical protein
VKSRALVLRYGGLEVTENSLHAHYQLDERCFVETVSFEGVGDLRSPAATSVAQLWYLVAGLSYYKAGAAFRIDLAHSPITPAGRALLDAALHDGLGEYAYRNELTLDDVEIVGGLEPSPTVYLDGDASSVLTPFGGGIDSVVTVHSLSRELRQQLFIVSPPSGRFAPLEATAKLTGLTVIRATRSIDPALLTRDPDFFNGHVPVTAMITLLATVAAVANGDGGVAMSNEHSASVPNFNWNGRDVNHQWSKSWIAEQLIADAVAASVGDAIVVASVLRDRSELWVAQQFAALTQYHHTFRSCNRAFAQQISDRATTWCGECDKCLFIDLVLAPFLERKYLASVLGVEPLSDRLRIDQLRTLVGLGTQRKPFECVGDPAECAVALRALTMNEQWRDEPNIVELESSLSSDIELEELLDVQGVSRVPTNWLR